MCYAPFRRRLLEREEINSTKIENGKTYEIKISGVQVSFFVNLLVLACLLFFYMKQ